MSAFTDWEFDFSDEVNCTLATNIKTGQKWHGLAARNKFVEICNGENLPVNDEVIQVENVPAWHFVEQYSNPFVTARNCDTGEFLMGDDARKKMAEDGGVAVSVMDADRRQWWALANPELAKGLKWWALPTPDDAPMAGPVSPFRGGWKDYSEVMVMTDEQIRAELLHRVLYGIPSVATPQGVVTVDANGEVVNAPRIPFAPAGVSPLSDKGYDVNEPKET